MVPAGAGLPDPPRGADRWPNSFLGARSASRPDSTAISPRCNTGGRRDRPQRVLRPEFPGGRAMKLHYYPDTDSLYIELNDAPGAQTREIVEGLVADLD